MIKHGQGVDLLVHEVAISPKAIESVDYVQAILSHHTSPEECGTVFYRTAPRMAAFTHIVQLQDQKNRRPDGAELERRTRTNWSGPLVIGTDLTRFVLNAGGVKVEHGDASRPG